VLIADGKSVNGLTFGAGANGEAALAASTSYFVYAVARDTTGNLSAVLAAAASTTTPAFTLQPTSTRFATTSSSPSPLRTTVFRVSPTSVAYVMFFNTADQLSISRQDPTTKVWLPITTPPIGTIVDYKFLIDMSIDAAGNILLAVNKYIQTYWYNATTGTWGVIPCNIDTIYNFVVKQ
jgi:hypothetical protein